VSNQELPNDRLLFHRFYGIMPHKMRAGKVFVLLFAAFRILRNNLLLKASSKERRIEKRGPIMRRKTVMIGAHHSFPAARPHFLLVGSNGGTDIGLRSNTPLFQFLAKNGCIMNGVVEALATILQRNLLAAFQTVKNRLSLEL